MSYLGMKEREGCARKGSDHLVHDVRSNPYDFKLHRRARQLERRAPLAVVVAAVADEEIHSLDLSDVHSEVPGNGLGESCGDTSGRRVSASRWDASVTVETTRCCAHGARERALGRTKVLNWISETSDSWIVK